jgi:hypothetical protein
MTSGVQQPPGNASCSGFSTLLQSSEAPFDGGGISADASVSCALTKDLDVSGPVASRSSVGRAGIPLGSTELTVPASAR